MCMCVGVWVCRCVGVWVCGWEVEGGNRPYSQESPLHASLPEG